jgi:hypothetical protein
MPRKLSVRPVKGSVHSKENNVVVGVTFTRPAYTAITKIKEKMGLPHEGDVIRLAVSFFKEKFDY